MKNVMTITIIVGADCLSVLLACSGHLSKSVSHTSCIHEKSELMEEWEEDVIFAIFSKKNQHQTHSMETALNRSRMNLKYDIA